ncbi:MAG: hypothetical protein WBN96_01295 [Gammaproteobacteria bacterium]
MPASDKNLFNLTDTQETAQSLELAIAQIDMALREADNSVTELMDAMSTMSCTVTTIEKTLAALSKESNNADTIDIMNTECAHANEAMAKAIMAFQFYDRLTQRFQHVHENLLAVANVIRAPGSEHPALWRNLRDKISSVYSLEQEQCLLQTFNSSKTQTNNNNSQTLHYACDDIELF